MSRSAPKPIDIRGPDGAPLPVVLRVNPRARRLSVRIDPAAGCAIATAPSKRAEAQAIAFAKSRAGWIAAALSRLPPVQRLAPGGRVNIGGVAHTLEAAPARAQTRLIPGEPPQLLVGGGDPDLFAARALRFLKALAREQLAGRVAVHAATLGVRPARMTVKDMRTRWGSCSSKGVLAFSWRVVMAPPAVLDYLAAHEVAHLREMNHSARFWALVEQCDPDYRAARAWLKAHGAALHAVGATA